jgi:predicted nicotinamide N-methyase
LAAEPEEDQERRAYGIRVLKPGHPSLRKLKSANIPTVQGFKYWSATWLLLHHLSSMKMAAGAQVMDVGCGWGFAGIYCAVRHGAQVTAVDIDPRVFPYLDLHAQLNDVAITTVEAAFQGVDEQLLSGKQWLIGADICFKEELIEPLLTLIESATSAGVGEIAITDPGRPAFERLAARCRDRLGARCGDLVSTEPLVDWGGTPLRLRGRLLAISTA